MPTEQVLMHLRNNRSFALTDCRCRTLAKNCDHPTEVCFLINDAADLAVKKGRARKIDLDEAERVMKVAEGRGLVHLTFFNPDQHLFAICNCCECCCHDLVYLKKLGRSDLIARSDYVALTDADLCTTCVECLESCPFEVRAVEEGLLTYDPEACYGCGACVPACPGEAISMERRQ
jgi:NAD-dependent dihydropyrimidine dehydrogenase PreA subunit